MYGVFMMPCTTRIVSCVPVSTVILMLSWDAAYRIVMLISLTYVVPDTYTTHTMTYMRLPCFEKCLHCILRLETGDFAA